VAAADTAGLYAPRGRRHALAHAWVLAVPVRGFRGEGGQADRDVLGAFLAGRRILNPLAAAHDHRLTGAHLEHARAARHAQEPPQDDRVLVELRRLTGLDPTCGTAHVRDRDLGAGGAHAADVLVDELGLVPGGGDTAWRGDESGHGSHLTYPGA